MSQFKLPYKSKGS